MTLLLLSTPGLFQRGGVTTSLNVSYVREVGPGDEVEVVGECVRMGKMIANLRGTMKRVSDGVTVATCDHIMANTDPLIKAKL